MSPRVKLVSATTVYLAGRIYKNDWRHSVVPELRGAIDEHSIADVPSPVLQTVNGLQYLGPFVVGDDHGCGHGRNSHGNSMHNCMAGAPFAPDFRRALTRRCQQGIAEADHVFAWIEDLECYGTLVELGIAAALGKDVWVYVKKDVDLSELWFGLHLASPREPLEFDDAESAARDFIDKIKMRARPL